MSPRNKNDILNSLHLEADMALDFLVMFSRFEFSVIVHGCRKCDDRKVIQVNWDKFKTDYLEKLDGPEIERIKMAGKLFLEKPPMHLKCNNGILEFQSAGRSGQSDAWYIFEGVRRARNNLFHGAKNNTKSIDNHRNAEVVSTAIEVLKALLEADSMNELLRTYNEIP